MTVTHKPEFDRTVQVEGIELEKARKSVRTGVDMIRECIWSILCVQSKSKGGHTTGFWERKLESIWKGSDCLAKALFLSSPTQAT